MSNHRSSTFLHPQWNAPWSLKQVSTESERPAAPLPAATPRAGHRGPRTHCSRHLLGERKYTARSRVFMPWDLLRHFEEWRIETPSYNMDRLGESVLTGRSQVQRATYCVIPRGMPRIGKATESDHRSGVARGCGGRGNGVAAWRVTGFLVGWWAHLKPPGGHGRTALRVCSMLLNRTL